MSHRTNAAPGDHRPGPRPRNGSSGLPVKSPGTSAPEPSLSRSAARAPLALALGLFLWSSSCSEGGEAKVLAFVAGPETQEPERPYYHDFGNVQLGQVVQHVFLLENQGSEPVQVLDVVPACGCTVPSLSTTGPDGATVESPPILAGTTPAEPLLTVAPGREAQLTIRVDADKVRPANAHKLHTTRVTTDAPDAYSTVETHILVEAPFVVVPEAIELGRLPTAAGGSTTNRISILSGYEVALTGELEASEGLTVTLEEKTELGGRFWDLTTTIDPPLALGRTRGSVTLRTAYPDGRPGKDLVLAASAFGVVDLQTTPTRIILVVPDEAVATEASTELFSLLDGRRPVVVDARLPEEHADALEVRFEPVSPDARGRSERWRIVLATRPPFSSDVLRGTLEVDVANEEEPFPIHYVVHQR